MILAENELPLFERPAAATGSRQFRSKSKYCVQYLSKEQMLIFIDANLCYAGLNNTILHILYSL